MYRESFAWVNGNQFPRTQTKSPPQCSFPQSLKSRPPTSKQDNPNAAKSITKSAFLSTLHSHETGVTVRQHLPLNTECLGKVNCKDSVPNRASEKQTPHVVLTKRSAQERYLTYTRTCDETRGNECVLPFSVQKGSILPRHTTASRRHTGSRW